MINNRKVDLWESSITDRFYILVRTKEFVEYVVINTCKYVVAAGPFMNEWIDYHFDIVISSLEQKGTFRNWSRWE